MQRALGQSRSQEELRPSRSQEVLTSLFSFGEVANGDQGWIRKRLLNIIQNFSDAEITTNGLDQASLAPQFRSSTRPELSVSPERYLDFLEDTIVPHSTNMSSPTCMGHMTSAVPSFIRSLGDLVLALNQNLVKRDASRTLTLLERQTIAIVHRLAYGFAETFYDRHIQDESSTLGIVSSGGTLANIAALWIARNSCFSPAEGFPGIEEAGASAARDHYHCQDAVIVGSTLMHYSLNKAAGLLGLGVNNLLKIPVDDNGSILIQELRNTITRCIAEGRRVIAIVGIAGTTDCGSIDPLAQMADIADEWNIHFHVDAAWGGPLLFSDRHRYKLAGIERARSITIDGHKQFYLPIGNSLLLLRDPQAARVIEKRSPYILHERSGDLGACSIEGSRPGTILFLHAALHILGSGVYQRIVDDNIRKAHAMAMMIRQRDEFELLVEPATNIVLYRYIPQRLRRCGEPQYDFTPRENTQINSFNEALQKAQAEAGRTFVSRTTIEHGTQGQGVPIVALRAVLTNPLAEDQHARLVLEDQAALGTALAARQKTDRAMTGTDRGGSACVINTSEDL